MAVEYRKAVGFDHYLVGSDGSVVSLPRPVKTRHGFRITPRRFLIAQKCGPKMNYLFVVLSENAIAKKCLLSHLVCEAFLGLRPLDHDVDHINGNTLDNSLGNLRYLHRSLNRGLVRGHNRKLYNLTH